MSMFMSGMESSDVALALEDGRLHSIMDFLLFSVLLVPLVFQVSNMLINDCMDLVS